MFSATMSLSVPTLKLTWYLPFSASVSLKSCSSVLRARPIFSSTAPVAACSSGSEARTVMGMKMCIQQQSGVSRLNLTMAVSPLKVSLNFESGSAGSWTKMLTGRALGIRGLRVSRMLMVKTLPAAGR